MHCDLGAKQLGKETVIMEWNKHCCHSWDFKAAS
jgi:hypothetical protein